VAPEHQLPRAVSGFVCCHAPADQGQRNWLCGRTEKKAGGRYAVGFFLRLPGSITPHEERSREMMRRA